jgi:hypothetical protein
MTAPVTVVSSLGMGVDSVALTLRWILDPHMRPAPLDRLLVVSAMTGDEWPQTGEYMEEYLLPLFRQHRIRYAQVSRAGMKNSAGIAVLDDSRAPQRMYMRGPVTLSEEMRAAGTIPQVGGERRCSLKWKGWPIDRYLEREVPGPFIHVMGFEAGEQDRKDTDAQHNTSRRTGRYPLIEWGWDRLTCQTFILAQLGVQWPKSACCFCPFALCNREGRDRVLDRYAADPAAGLPALMMEHVARSLNPLQGLAGVRRKTQTRPAQAITLTGLLQQDPRQRGLLAMFARQLDEVPWKLYEVQRAYLRQGTAPRNLRALATGSRTEMTTALRTEAARDSAEISPHDGIERAWLLRRSVGDYPGADWLLVAAPAGVADKTGRGFGKAWEAALDATRRNPGLMTQPGLTTRRQPAASLT